VSERESTSVERKIEAGSDMDALRKLVQTVDAEGIADTAEVRVTVGFARGLLAALARLEAERDALAAQVREYSGTAREQAFARAEALEQRVAFLLAEAHGWQPKLEAAEAKVASMAERAVELVKHGNAVVEDADRRMEAAEAERDNALQARDDWMGYCNQASARAEAAEAGSTAAEAGRRVAVAYTARPRIQRRRFALEGR
jgi:hypothetical protein